MGNANVGQRDKELAGIWEPGQPINTPTHFGHVPFRVSVKFRLATFWLCECTGALTRKGGTPIQMRSDLLLVY